MNLVSPELRVDAKISGEGGTTQTASSYINTASTDNTTVPSASSPAHSSIVKLTMKASYHLLLSIALPLATALATPSNTTDITPQPDTPPEELDRLEQAIRKAEELSKNAPPGEEQKQPPLEARSDIGYIVDLAYCREDFINLLRIAMLKWSTESSQPPSTCLTCISLVLPSKPLFWLSNSSEVCHAFSDISVESIIAPTAAVLVELAAARPRLLLLQHQQELAPSRLKQHDDRFAQTNSIVMKHRLVIDPLSSAIIDVEHESKERNSTGIPHIRILIFRTPSLHKYLHVQSFPKLVQTPSLVLPTGSFYQPSSLSS
ncbi:hypothetical protein HRG_014782 [Hirsutella rhossiliensis]